MTIAYQYHSHSTEVLGAPQLTNILFFCSLHRFSSASARLIEKPCHAEPGNWRALYNLDESVLGSIRTFKRARQRPHPAAPGATSTNSLSEAKVSRLVYQPNHLFYSWMQVQMGDSRACGAHAGLPRKPKGQGSARVG